MPYTLNGIGTTYYGKKHLERHHGVCDHCGHRGELQSYETRLWFVFVFIPIIPLGKKQILDYCPKCRRHRAVAVEDWRRIGEDTLTKGMAELAEKPNDPEVAMRMHEMLVFFNKNEEAAKLAKLMASNFADNADVQMHLGAWYEKEQQADQADRCFERALEIDPNNHYARRAAAIGCIQKGELDRAQELLSCMDEPGPHCEPSALFLLASAYQQKGRHSEALAIFQKIKTRFPELAQKDKTFRRAVTESEKHLGKRESMLPKAPLNWRLVAGGVVILLVIVGVIVADYYLKTHQTLYIVNQFSGQAALSIAGEGEFSVPGQSVEEITVPEGDFTVFIEMEHGVSESVDVTIKNSMAQRVAGDTAFILNVGGSAVLIWEQMKYSENPDPDDPDAYYYRLHHDSRFLTLRKIDYFFNEEFPDEVSIDEGSSAKKTRLSVLELEPSQLVYFLSGEEVDPETLLNYAEAHLLDNLADEELLQFYYRYIFLYDALDRGMEFFQQKLSQRPVLIEWHRLYQTLYMTVKEQHDLFSKYDAILAEDPENSALLYLRGRIEPGLEESLTYFEQAIQADSANPYPWFAKAYGLASSGDFAGAREACGTANTLKPDDTKVQELLFFLRFALGEYDALEKETEDALKQSPLNFSLVNSLLQIRSAQGNIEGAKSAHDQFLRDLQAEVPEDPYNLERWAGMRLAYLSQDFAEYTRIAETIEEQDDRENALFYIYLLQGDMEAVESLIDDPKQNHLGFTDLLVSLGWKLSGDSEKTETWFRYAVESFRNSTGEEQQIAQLLEYQGEHILDQVDDLTVFPLQKAILYAALAAQFPAERHELLARAEQFNVLMETPYFFLKNAIETLRKQ